ncbi:MAG: polysaccharide biosynthesis protein [Thermodesulfovibrio sp.]|nr:polysaccharide biosynthesis protein [Thermodesulfovibrio sp.]
MNRLHIVSLERAFSYLSEETNILKIIGREQYLFDYDLLHYSDVVEREIKNSSFLVIGGAGSIGSATIKEIFKRNPKVLHVIDINENDLAELVRDLRSSYGYIDGEFKTFVIDVGSDVYHRFITDNFNKYNYVLNFSALKHVRSEKDPYTLMRMVEVNILNVNKTLEYFMSQKIGKYFCVSTDKATNPVNMMGASKRIMELFLYRYSDKINISTARFANVAFSNGSLLYSFLQRIQKKQPIVAPDDIKRYFMAPTESGKLCLLSSLLGKTREIFFPKLNPERHMNTPWDVAVRLLEHLGFEPYVCESEEEARRLAPILPEKGKWACFVSKTDTTGEKGYEEFYAQEDEVDFGRFKDIGITKIKGIQDESLLDYFITEITRLRNSKVWSKKDLVYLFEQILPDFKHEEKGKYLDDKM